VSDDANHFTAYDSEAIQKVGKETV